MKKTSFLTSNTVLLVILLETVSCSTILQKHKFSPIKNTMNNNVENLKQKNGLIEKSENTSQKTIFSFINKKSPEEIKKEVERIKTEIKTIEKKRRITEEKKKKKRRKRNKKSLTKWHFTQKIQKLFLFTRPIASSKGFSRPLSRG